MDRGARVTRLRSTPIRPAPSGCWGGRRGTKTPRRSSARRGTGSRSTRRGTGTTNPTGVVRARLEEKARTAACIWRWDRRGANEKVAPNASGGQVRCTVRATARLVRFHRRRVLLRGGGVRFLLVLLPCRSSPLAQLGNRIGQDLLGLGQPGQPRLFPLDGNVAHISDAHQPRDELLHRHVALAQLR